MHDILTLRDEKSHAVRCAEDILNKAEKEGRVLTEEEKRQTSEYLAEAERISKQIDEIEDHERRAEQIRKEAEQLRAHGQRRSEPTQPGSEPKATSRVDVVIPAARYGRLQAFKGENAAENAFTSGMWLVAKLFPTDHPMKYRAERWCKENGVFDSIRNAMSTVGSGSALIPDVLAQTVIDLREQFGVFRQWADVMPMSSDHQIVPVQTGQMTADFVGENVSLENVESAPDFTNVTLTAKKIAAMARMSTEVSEDAIVTLADRIARDMSWAFAKREDDLGWYGDGTAGDGGISGVVTLLESGNFAGSAIEVATNTHDTFASIDHTDLTRLMGALPQYARAADCAWFCSQTAADAVFGRLKATAGGNTIGDLASGGINQVGQRGVVGSYLGYPIVTSQILPTVDGSHALDNKVMLLFGSLRLASLIGERRMISIAVTDQRYWELDQIAIKATSRIDINVHSLGDATTAGPIVGLTGSQS